MGAKRKGGATPSVEAAPPEPVYCLPPESKAAPITRPVMILEREWVAGNGERVILTFNNRAKLTLEEMTGVSAFAFAFAPKAGFSYIATLTYCCARSWMVATGREGLTFDNWIDEPWLPHYMTAEWNTLVRNIQEQIEATFPDAEEQRTGLRLLLSAILAESPQAFSR